MRSKHLFAAGVLVLSLGLSACSFSPGRGTAAPSPKAANSATQAPLEADPTTAQTEAITAAPTQPGSAGVPGAAMPGADQPVEVFGSFEFTNEIILTYYIQHAVGLTDMYGFVTRDEEWEIPLESQTLGFMDIDPEAKKGTFTLRLPALPGGTQADVNPDGKAEAGVQIYAVDYSPNMTGGPFAEGDDRSRGWPSYLASVKTDSENNDEVTGGKLLIWSPDAQQFFPSDFGADGLLFTQDDPVMPVPEGYAVVDLDQSPFQMIRDARAEFTLYEPDDAAIKDFSELSYKEAFDKMFEIVRKEYAFNGIEGKQPDWDSLYADLAPKVDAAAADKDAEAYYQALREFTLAFKDGHVSVDGGEIAQRLLGQQFAGGYGFAVRELTDGRVMVVHVVEGGPAQEAGMQVGAVISQFKGKAIDEAIQGVQPPSAPHSTPSNQRLEQVRYLVRDALGTKAAVTFTNPEQSAAATAELEAVQEQESIGVTSPYRNTDPNGLPVEYVVANERVGYVRISSNYDDLNLIIRLFQRALTKFKENELDTVIIDMRANPGGAPLGLAGYLTDQTISMGQLEYYSEKTGQFEAEGLPEEILPNETQFRFDKLFLLVDSSCASACEIESYGFSQVPGLQVIGETPTSGTEAEVSRGQFELPEGISVRIPTGRFVLPDGSIFLEGVGVQPDVLVPVTEETVLSSSDPLIRRALELASE